jgi:ATP adenylyltransferase
MLLEGEASKHVADSGLISLNGTILAGAMMVKAEAEWHRLQSQPSRLLDLLRVVGIPPNVP